MNVEMARRLDAVVVRWLVEQGGLPPWAGKARPDWTVEAEAKLHKKLQGLFTKSLDQLWEEIRRREFPAAQADQLELIHRYLVPAGEQMGEVIAPAGVEAATHGRRTVEHALRQARWRIRYSPLPGNTADVLQDRVFAASRDTMGRIVGDVQEVMDTLAGAVREGTGIDEATRRLRSVFDGLEEHRLRSIAITEINTAQGFGNHETMREYGVEYKRWLTALDNHVRLSHIDLHGHVMRTDEAYANGLMYPGDRSGPIREWIQCR